MLDFSSTSIFWKQQKKIQNKTKKYFLTFFIITHIWQRNSLGRLERLEMAEAPKTLKELFSPISNNPPSCIILPETTASHFELKPHIINLLPNFHGMEKEDPYMHVKDFLDICSTFKFQNFTDYSVHLRLFPFSLKDKAKAWLNSLPAGVITSWDTLTQ